MKFSTYQKSFVICLFGLPSICKKLLKKVLVNTTLTYGDFLQRALRIYSSREKKKTPPHVKQLLNNTGNTNLKFSGRRLGFHKLSEFRDGRLWSR